MIEVKDLTFGYNKEGLFNNLSLSLAPGNIYGLLGLNGAGKTTLLKLITGLLYPQAGSMSVLGHEPIKREPSFLNQVFMLPEELNLPGITDAEYLLTLAPFYPGFDLERFDRYLQEFDIPRGKRLTKLSYGQKKKFLLSFGLACNSSLLVLDEPTNGLDIPSKGQFRRLVAESLSEDRIFVISTHQVKDVENLIDPIVVLHEGKVLLSLSMAELNQRIRMSHSKTRPEADADGLLYSEPAVGGFWTVWIGDGEDEDGPVDLEVLFNTVISRPEVTSGLFETEGALA